MKKWQKVLCTAIIAVLLPCCYTASSLAQDVLAGVDLWETRPGDAVHEFGGGSECPPIPADFFEPGSDPFTGTVSFQGQPLQTTPPGALGTTDTVVERLQDTAFLPECHTSATVDIEIVALSLVSVQPITVTSNGGMNPQMWDVEVCLSEAVAQQTGSKTINRECDEGGSFGSQIPVTPKFIFTRVGNPADKRFLDYGFEGLNPILYTNLGGSWLYSDPGFSVLTTPGGVLVDHDCNGTTPDVMLGAGSNFYPGLQATPCICPNTSTGQSIVSTLWQSLNCGSHTVYPPLVQAPPTIEPIIATECPEVQTECPALQTQCPVIPTWCPNDPTFCPKDPPVCPPDEFTIWPELPTQCPVVFTACPAGPTLCPDLPTACPSTQTWCPEIPTECPIDPVFTLCPLNDTQCPDEPTNCPLDWTFCPDIPTVCPGIPTECPEVVTTCPATPTICTTTTPTVCPVDPTNCPTGPTFCSTVDTDGDGIDDCSDNCPNRPNGPSQGTCTQAVGVNLIVSTGQFCFVDGDCDPGEFCEKTQADNYPPGGNGIGDACDCEGNFDCDVDTSVDADDVNTFLADFGRSMFFNPCTNALPCNGDFLCDGDVDADDVTKFLEDFGRNPFFEPCPSCTPGAWCTYP